jgi:hypothetical protein
METCKHLHLKLCRTALGKMPYYKCEAKGCGKNFEVPEPLVIKVIYPIPAEPGVQDGRTTTRKAEQP